MPATRGELGPDDLYAIGNPLRNNPAYDERRNQQEIGNAGIPYLRLLTDEDLQGELTVAPSVTFGSEQNNSLLLILAVVVLLFFVYARQR